jgi:hypothetical protein
MLADAERVYQTFRLPFTLKACLARVFTIFQRDLPVKAKLQYDCPTAAGRSAYCPLCEKRSAPYLDILIHAQLCHPYGFPKNAREFSKFIRNTRSVLEEAFKRTPRYSTFDDDIYRWTVDVDFDFDEDSEATMSGSDVDVRVLRPSFGL